MPFTGPPRQLHKDGAYRWAFNLYSTRNWRILRKEVGRGRRIVARRGGVAEIDIDTGAITARFGMKHRDAVSAARIVRESHVLLREKWIAIHEPR